MRFDFISTGGIGKARGQTLILTEGGCRSAVADRGETCARALD